MKADVEVFWGGQWIRPVSVIEIYSGRLWHFCAVRVIDRKGNEISQCFGNRQGGPPKWRHAAPKPFSGVRTMSAEEAARRRKHRDVRRMWQYGSDLIFAKRGRHTTPLAVVDLRHEAIERLIEKVARAIHGGSWTFDVGPDSSRDAYYDDARAALEAVLGRLPKK